ncbi:MAG TPA: hypothetical protein VFH68_05150 [Polyangia bacterium]|nr:hypothetical protein [Polyangia bacterium]
MENNKTGFSGRILLSVALVGLGGARAVAKDVSDADASEQAKLRMAFWAGPSLYETGRVGAMTISDPTDSSKLDHQLGMMPKEQLVEPATPDPNRAMVATHSGYLNASILALQIREQVPTLSACRVQLARSEDQVWNKVEGGRVNLRWTIRANGTVADPEVVAVDPIDLHLLNCVKQQIGAWTFARPRGGMMPVDFSYTFRYSALADGQPLRSAASNP